MRVFAQRIEHALNVPVQRPPAALCFEVVKSSYGNHALRLDASEREEVSSRPFLFGSATERTQPGTRLASVHGKRGG